MMDIYKTWVDFGIDGFRIDTVKHVNMEFWQKFSPGDRWPRPRATATKNFFMFGEVYDADPAFMSPYTTTGKLPATLDFGFQAQRAGFARAAGDRAARPVRRRRLLHRRRLQRLRTADLPRQPRHGPRRHVPQARRRNRRTNCCSGTSWRTR